MALPHLEPLSNSSNSLPELEHIGRDFSEQLLQEPEEAVAAREILRYRLRRNIQEHEIRRNGPSRNQRLFRMPQRVPPFAMRGPIPTAERTAPPRPRGSEGQGIYNDFPLSEVAPQAIEWPAVDESSIPEAPVEVVHVATGHLDTVEPVEATEASLELTVEEAAFLCNRLGVPFPRAAVTGGLNDAVFEEARLMRIVAGHLPEGPGRNIISMIIRSRPIISMIKRAVGGCRALPPDGNWETVSARVGSLAIDELGAIINDRLGVVKGGSPVTDRDVLAGNSYRNHAGNKIRNSLVRERKPEHDRFGRSLGTHDKTGKPRIAREIIRDILIVGGRFLERIDEKIPIGQHPSGFDWRIVPLKKVKERETSRIRSLKRGRS